MRDTPLRANQQCCACGQITTYHPYTLRLKVPPFRNSYGTVPGWWAYACSPICKEKLGMNSDRNQLNSLKEVTQ